MMNNIYSLSVGQAVRATYNKSYRFTGYEMKDFPVPSIFIFGPFQGRELAFFEKSLPKDKKIIFKGKKATNSNHPNTGPRNTLLVVDKVEVQTLSEMP